MKSHFTTGEAGARFGVEVWRVRRLFEDGTLPEPGRLAGNRVIPSSMLPKVEAALRDRGWLPSEAAEVSSA